MLVSGADKPESDVKVVPNTGRFPFPSARPVLNGSDGTDYNWKAYIESAKSDADRAFRANLCPLSELRLGVRGGDDSTAGEMTRYLLAVEEYRKKCDRLIDLYRKKLASDPPTLKLLNEFISQSEAAMASQVQFIGGSWGAGSGAKSAYAQARARAQVNFHQSLLELRESLHLQDLPEL
ncbi:MAG: hypothetical protein ACAH88_19155 [Roseimicrobium sp.]